MAPTTMKELSIRYMEPFRTSLDIIHTYGTHVNMSISFSAISCNGASNRDLRDDRAPLTGRFTGSYAYTLADLAEHATPNVETRQIRSRNCTNGTVEDGLQGCADASVRRGPASRRSHAPTRALKVFSTTAGNTAMMLITPKH